MSEQRAVPEIPEDLRVQYGELMFVKKSGWHNSNVDERKFLSSIQLIERIAALTAERDSAKRELAELQADAKAERKKYEALREENAALKAECMVTLRALIEEDAAVIYRVTSKILAARTTPPAKEPK